MAIINLWTPAPTEHSKSPGSVGPGAKKEHATQPIWSVDVTFEGRTIKDFPLTYIIKYNNPWIYLEVLKTTLDTSGAPVVPATMTPQQATTGTDQQGSLIARFTNALNSSIDNKLVPLNPQYANIKIIFTTLSQSLHQAAQKSGGPGGRDDSDGTDMMEIVKAEHPDVMAMVTPDSPAWNAIRGTILKELNQNNLLCDANGKSNPLQKSNIEGRGGPIRSIILNVLRSLGLLKA